MNTTYGFTLSSLAWSDHTSRLYTDHQHVDQPDCYAYAITTLERPACRVAMTEDAAREFIADMCYQAEFNDRREAATYKRAAVSATRQALRHNLDLEFMRYDPFSAGVLRVASEKVGI